MSRTTRYALKRFRPLFAMVVYGLSGLTWAASWEVVPTLSITEGYTDNVSLAPDASKQDDWISEVVPGISIAAEGARMRFDATYTPQFLYYVESSIEETNHRLGVTADAELARKLLFLDVGANVNQYNASILAPQGTNNVNSTGNRETIKTFSASPYLKRDLGSAIQLEARFTHSVVKSDNPMTLSDSDSDRADLLLNSGPMFKRLIWDFDYAREDLDNDSQLDILIESANANARRLITPAVSLLGRVGYEYYEQGAAPVIEDNSWSAGLGWAPTPRTNFEATAGKRFFGDAYRLDFTHRTRLTTWSTGYSEDVTSTRANFFIPATTSTASYLDTLFSSQFPDPVSRQKAVEEFVVGTGLPPDLSAPTNFFTNQLFIEKKWQASAGVLGVRNVVIANIFRQTRERLDSNFVLPSALGFVANESVIQTGFGIVWDWNLTSKNGLALNLSFGRNELSGNRNDKTSNAGFGFTRRFQPRLFGSLKYQRQSLDSNQSVFNYTENSIFATITKVF